MIHLANLLLVCLLLVNLTGLALLIERFTGSWILARTASPLLIAVPFFVEHFAGFGSLAWLWPIATGASIWFIARRWPILRAHWRIESVYFGAFAYGLCWRYCFPDLTPSSEKLTDLAFVANYLPGGRLPPTDRWFPPSSFDMYYALQHYGAALLGRILGASAGQAYNLAFCVLVASSVTAAAGVAWLLVRRRLAVVLLAGAFLFGGTGVAPLIRLVTPSPALHSSVRFAGSTLSREFATRPFGKWLLRVNRVTPDSLDLPVELFSYLVGLGDYHPPLGGYLLLMLALLCCALIEAREAEGPAHALLGATVPLTIACNTWDFPVQALLAGGYLCYRLGTRQPVAWKMLLAGFAAAALSIQPFLARFATHALEVRAAIRLVPRAMHTPPLLWLLIFYPVVALLVLHLFWGERSSLSLTFCALSILLLIGSEFVFVDDLYGGKFERFNTVLKWWGWTYSGAVLAVGAFNLRSASRLCRWGTAVVLLVTCSYGADLAAVLAWVPKVHVGQLDGAGWVRDDTANRAILEFLQTQPPCLVLQRLADRSYTAAPALAMFAGQTAFLGWPNHEDNWRGNRLDIDRRMDQVAAFYRGELPDSARWLEQNGIQYVLWLREENQLPKQTFERIDGNIRDRYSWHDYYVAGDYRVGLWSLDRH